MPSTIDGTKHFLCALIQFCSHLKMRLSETKDELAQCFASVSILSNHDVELRSKSFTFGKT